MPLVPNFRIADRLRDWLDNRQLDAEQGGWRIQELHGYSVMHPRKFAATVRWACTKTEARTLRAAIREETEAEEGQRTK